MYAAQYEITLPADYDMEIIRRRVATYGHLFDDRAGLGLKAYLIRERGVDGSPVNQYAPFYLWSDTGAMAHFLVGGGGFQAIVRDFGRPVVQHWTVVATLAGPARHTVPVTATSRRGPVPTDPDPAGTGLAERIEREIAEVTNLAGRDGVHTAVLAVDPRHWQLLRFVLWATSEAAGQDGEATERYAVPHLSVPGLAHLPEGRHW
ncbi:DUF4865 family protein [Micromonospora sp. HM5-17]|uniref:DUF4865 family protein n=1 Tax=Micromonospora sp. HM5-17 TaxID=2487710 RepID=UPI000F47F7A1|nr:DUF4865 family protein [Micromonospora sp. HM5-17]ROT31630.1 DUF4865 family protein [Micromonospora sp. HM5-17]